MILIIGKKDRAKALDMVAYLNQCGDHHLSMKPLFGDAENNKRIANDCKSLASRLLKSLGLSNKK